MNAPILLFGGKGGVGKTTLAAASAWRAAERGASTLLVSTDPAHSTADLLGCRLGPEPRVVEGRLSALEVDPEAHARDYVDAILRDAAEAVSAAVQPALERHLRLAAQAPGTIEAALFDRFAEIMTWAGTRFERIVFDTAPSGHSLRLLTLPDLLSAWVAGLQRQREKVTRLQGMWQALAGTREPPRADRVLARLRQRAERLRQTRTLLREQAVFHPVLIPEKLAVEETARLIPALEDAGLRIGTLHVNRVLPAHAGNGYWRARLAQQAEYLAEIERRFSGREIARVEQAPRDVAAWADLLGLARGL